MKDIKAIFDNLDKKLEAVAKRNHNKLPYTTVDGVYDNKYETDVCWWTNGFYPGLMWVMYNATKKDCYKEAARAAQKLLKEAFNNRDGLHHDVGFMWYLSEGSDYILTGDKSARDTALYAADMLAARFNLKGGFIRAWNEENGLKRDTWTIIDCMMNIPLLYWASKEIDDERYALIAKAHADMAMGDHVRDNGSTNHICIHDNEDRSLSETLGGQGLKVGSCWSRGNAWAIYGFAQSFLHTNEKKYLDTAVKCADYFIDKVEKTNWIAPSDFDQGDEHWIIDTSAGAIAACGMVEIWKATGNAKYRDAAINIIKATAEKYCDWDIERDGVVMYGSEAYNTNSIHKHLVYADYYFAECVALLLGNSRTN
ncbi:MAG: glycoside hydrolase family 88 protein [Clostridia bacterium]|nr:glycoside hydrolase family 88 protein [Clostridia bacterium]